MKLSSVKTHLRPYSIRSRRTTTINHAFAAAIAESDGYDEKSIRDAVLLLEQNPDLNLLCVYCRSEAETWDHLRATVSKGEYSGFGHQIGNLVPCCKRCNSHKGGKDWKSWMRTEAFPDVERKIKLIERYTKRLLPADFKQTSKRVQPAEQALLERYKKLREKVLKLLSEADMVASQLRNLRNR